MAPLDSVLLRWCLITSAALLVAYILVAAPAFGEKGDMDIPLVSMDVPLSAKSIRNVNGNELTGTAWHKYQREPAERALTSTVKVACLYVGFMRDYKRMLSEPKYYGGEEKFYGNQHAAILEPLDCDVFITTWHIGGKGRFNTFRYDTKDIVQPRAISAAYGRRLAVLHIQNYTLYEPLWNSMISTARNFTEAYPVEPPGWNHGTVRRMWRWEPRYRMFFRSNDYSQSYKHWVAVRLADSYPVAYDLYYRLRPDLRASESFLPLERIGSAFRFRMSDAPHGPWHVVNSTSVHVHAPDISDFGFFGFPENIRYLAAVWPELCLARGQGTVKTLSAMTDADVRAHHADYNRVVWYLVFRRRWSVDFGLTYLHVSRRYGETVASLRRRK